MVAGWLQFDTLVSQWVGLDESKYEWAVVEKEVQDQQNLEALANDSVIADRTVLLLSVILFPDVS
jgi:hypothetical protein